MMNPKDLEGKHIITTHDEKYVVKILKHIKIEDKEMRSKWTFDSYIYKSPYSKESNSQQKFYLRKDQSDWKIITEDEAYAELI